MWLRIADIILKYRIALLVFVLLLGTFMGYYGISNFQISQEFTKVIPRSDQDYQNYQYFRQKYGEDGGAMLVGLKGEAVYTKGALNDLLRLSREVKTWDGVKRVANVTQAVELYVDTSGENERFATRRVMSDPLQRPAQADSLKRWLFQQPFYKGILYSPDSAMSVFVMGMTKETMQEQIKHKHIERLRQRLRAIGQRHGFETYFSGLPYIRHYVHANLPTELGIFSFLALLLTAIALFAFYRSLYAVIFPLILLVIACLCTVGIVALLGYSMTILTAILPPVIIILGIPPSIYMLSDYHEEYKICEDKIQALRQMVRKLGLVTLMINANTAFGFLTLYFTQVTVLQEFGLVAFLATMLAYVITIILIPGVFSLLPPPSENNLKHLDAPRINKIVSLINNAVAHHRIPIYVVTVVLLVVSAIGISQLRAVSYMTDDLPKNKHVVTDMREIERHFNGALPLEILLDTRKNEGAMDLKTLKKVDQLQEAIEAYPEVSRTVSLADVVKWGRQALADGEPSAYRMPLQQEYDFIQMYAARSGLMKGPNQDRSPPDTASERPGGQPAMLANMTDSLQRQIRISGFVRDIGSNRMPKLLARIRADIDSLFPARFIGEEVNDSLRVVNNPELLEQAGDESPAATAGDPAQQGAQASAAGAPDKAEAEDEAYVEALITGTTRIFIKANEYLLNNLGWALVAAFTIIGLQMFALFASWRIMWISMIPNLIPLGMTAAIMGFAGIPLKPSTALIYEMAFGIAIDNSIHYLAMYRQHRKNGCGVDEAVRRSLRVTGMSIIYTSVVLFMGFIIFVPSAFGSTSSMGTLTAITLFIATFSNLLLMPALLVNFDRRDRVIDKALIDEE